MIVTVRAHAKLTWSLCITGVRADGYHLIDAEMSTLDLHDVLTLDPSRTGIDVTGPYAAGVPIDDRNLVVPALRFAGRHAHVTVDKRIPHGGGLGGGSADAAAVLRWAGVHDVASTAAIGADVPFCLIGGRARVGGIGEVVEPLPHVDRVVSLVIPPLEVNTPAVYRAWDELGGPTGSNGNDLEPAALHVVPERTAWRDRIGETCGTRPLLAGSGATWFVEGDHAAALAPLRELGAAVIVTSTVQPH